jgi:hypothetical protein
VVVVVVVVVVVTIAAAAWYCSVFNFSDNYWLPFNVGLFIIL